MNSKTLYVNLQPNGTTTFEVNNKVVMTLPKDTPFDVVRTKSYEWVWNHKSKQGWCIRGGIIQ